MQSSLPGFDEAPEPRDRLFLALFPPSEVAQSIEQLTRATQRAQGVRGTLVSAARLHVTLHHLGDFAGIPQRMVDAVQRAGTAMAQQSPFQVCFDRFANFQNGPRKRLLVLRGAEEGLARLVSFHQALGLAMAKEGLGRQVASTFTPHLTLLYADGPVIEDAIEPVTWTVRDCVLVHSLLGEHQHTPLARWTLQG